MALVTELDVVNACLAVQGESPVNSLAEFNPAITSARDILSRVNIREQARGWWFNKESVVINPNADTFYYLPADTIGLVVGDDGNEPWMSSRGRRIYDNRIGAYHTGTKPITVQLIRNVPFDELPFTAASMIRDATVLHYTQNFDGDAQKVSVANGMYNDARTECNAEHIRAVRANMLTSGGAGLRRAHSRYPTTRLRDN